MIAWTLCALAAMVAGPWRDATAQTAQTITFAALAGKTYGNAPFVVSATASSGLPVSFSSLTTPVCTVAGNTVTIVAAGTCTIRASQAGDATYAPAPNVDRSFAVAKAAQTITFGALAAKTFGNPPFAVSATASSSLTVAFSSTTTTKCTVSGTTVTIVAAGTCTIRASQAGNANYNAATNVDQSFTIAKASQTITFGALTGKTFGDPPFVVSATASSGLAVTFSSTTTTKCTVSGSTVTIVAAGTCTIRASQAGNTNYNAATNVDQSFAIAKANQTISFTAPPSTRLDQTPVAVAATATSGLAVAFSSLTTTICTVSGTAVTLRAVGACTIRATQAGNTNYNAAPNVDRSFSVTKGNQTISFGALTDRAFGSGSFTVSATATSALAVTFSSVTAGVCTVSGTTVTLVAVGTCTIRAAQAGNTNWNAAANVDQSFAITKANQTIAFGTINPRAYGTAPAAVTATANSGLAVTFTSLTTGVCTIAGSTLTLAAAGPCTLRASQAGNANWNAAVDVEQSFLVLPAGQTITFGAIAPQWWGAVPFSVSATATSGQPVSFISQSPSTCSVSGSTVALLAVGSCTILASQPGSANYTGATATRSFAIIGPIEFGPATNVLTVLWVDGIGAADFTGDGKQDILAAGQGVAVHGGTGTGTIGAPSVQYGILGTRISVGDVNGDGRPDVVVAVFDTSGDTGLVNVYLRASATTFQTPTTLATGIWPTDVRLADFNGDGKLDLVVSDGASSIGTFGGESVQIYLGKGDGSFHAPNRYNIGYDPRGISVADFNGDGKLDLVVVSRGYGTYSILLGNGDGTFASPVTYSGLSAPIASATADFNGDGKADLVVIDETAHTASVFLGRGDGTFLGPLTLLVGDQYFTSIPDDILVRDLNNDGRPDIAIASAEAGQVVVYASVGDGTFLGPVFIDGGNAPWRVTAADLNGDGRLDLITAADSGTTLGIALNTGAVSPSATISALAGTPQSASVGAAYPVRLSAVVRNAASQPVAGQDVLFVAPTVGPSGTFAGSGASALTTTDAAGIAVAPVLTASGIPGGFSVVATSGTASALFALSNVGTPSVAPTFITGPPPAGTVNLPYAYTVVASGSPPPAYSVLPNALPPGLSLASGSGVISGIPNTVGTYAGTIAATNAVTPDANQAFAISISLNAQVITFAPLPGKTYGDSPFTVSATSSSGLAVTFASTTTTVCSVDRETVTILTTGTCAVQASQAGDAAFAPAASVSRSFAVAKATQTITFDPLFNRFLGGAPFTIAASSSSGLSVSFTSLTTAVCTVSGSTVTIVATGTCTIRAAQAGNSFFNAAAIVNQGFVVQPAGTNQPPTVVLTTPSNNAIFGAPAIVPLLASVTDGDGSVVRVEFYEGTALLGVSATAPHRFVWSGIGPGSYSLTARAYDDRGTTATSNPVSIVVSAAPSALSFASYPDPLGAIAQSAGTVHPLDSNADGKKDLLVQTSGKIRVLFGDGNGGFAGVMEYTLGGLTCPGAGWGVGVSADFNNDSKGDFVVASGVDCVTVVRNNGDGSLAPPFTTQIVGTAIAVAAGDFNGDGKADTATANDEGTISILLGNGDGTLAAPTSLVAGTQLRTIAAADFNGDGKLDLAAGDEGAHAIRLLLGNGNGTFQPAQTVPLPATASPYGLRAVDLDADGRIDLVTANRYSPTVSVLMGNGDGTFRPSVEFPAGEDPIGIAVADFDTDGKLDLAVTASDAFGSVAILIGNGDGTFRQPVSFAVSPFSTEIAAADLNNDGRVDLVASGSFGLSILINTTGLTTQAPVITSNPLLPEDVRDGTYTFQFTASGLPSPVFSSLTTDRISTTGVLSIDLPDAGIHRGTVRAANGVSPDALQDYTFVVRRKTQTISFSPGPFTIYPLDCWLPCRVTATGTSGLPVTFRTLTPATCSVLANGEFTTNSVGTCTLRAEQAGSVDYSPAPPVDRTLEVRPKTAEVVITSPESHAGFAAPANITISANARPADGPIVTSYVYRVDFLGDGQVIGSDYTEPYSVVWSNVPSGTHTIVARKIEKLLGQPGEATLDSDPVTVIVASASGLPVVTLTAPAPGSHFFYPATIPLAATASVAAGTITQVDFYNGPFWVGLATQPPYTFNWANAPPGNYSISAKVTTAAGVTASSNAVPVVVDTDTSAPIAAFDFNQLWDGSGVVLEQIGEFPAVRNGAVSQVASPAAAPKPDTCKAAEFTGGTLDLAGLPVSATLGARTTLAFWIKWNGTDGAMPASWATQGLWFSSGGFGFTTGGGDLFGVTSGGYANTWRHVVAEFVNGGVTSNRLWVDGVEQVLVQRQGAPSGSAASAGPVLRLGGQAGSTSYRFGGQLDDVFLFSGPIAAPHVAALAGRVSPCAPVSVSLVAPTSGSGYVAPATVDLAAIATNSDGTWPQVRFYNGATEIGTLAATPPYKARVSNLAPGNYTFTATATTAGSTVTSSPVMVTVNPPPVGQSTIEIAHPANGATLYTQTPTHIMASITTAPGFSVLRVNYYADGVVFAYRTKAPYNAHVRFLVAGSYALTVEVIDSGGYKSLSLPVTVTIVDGTPSVVYYHDDASGSAVAASDQAGNLVWLEAYRPWGERVLGDDAGTKNGIWYAGKPVEDATGLAYLGARWYSAEVGRFYGVDPVSFREAEPKSVNRYAYANNNPYRYVDPDGQMPIAIPLLIGAVSFVADLFSPMPQVAPGSGQVIPFYGIEAAAVGAGGPAGLAAGVSINAVRRADQVADVASAARALSTEQAANLSRFVKKLPRGAGETTVRDLPGGGRVFQAEVPGRVPGSRAVYEKQVDSAGRTIQYTKTTYDPAGNIPHVKDKITGEVLP